MASVMGAEEFFNSVSGEYDDMIDFQSAVHRRRELLRPWLSQTTEEIIDFGAGSGVDSISASLLGHNVTAVDISGGMIERLRENAKQMGTDVRTFISSIHDAPQELSSKFSFALCLGNTLALVPEFLLLPSMRRIAECLFPGGHALIQILNYAKIQRDLKRIVAVTHKGTKHFVRFYDFLGKRLFFNILSFDSTEPGNHKLQTSEVFPYTIQKLTGLAAEAGFIVKQSSGGLARNAYDPLHSADLVLLLEHIK